MDDSGINAFCDLFGQTFSRDQFKYQFRRRTRLRENIVFIRKTLVTDMMIDTRCFFCIGFDDAEEELKRMEEFRKAQAEVEQKKEKPMSQKMFKVV